jgi:hypothetical protein
MRQLRRRSGCGAGPTGSRRAGVLQDPGPEEQLLARRPHSGVAAVLHCNGAPTAGCSALLTKHTPSFCHRQAVNRQLSGSKLHSGANIVVRFALLLQGGAHATRVIPAGASGCRVPPDIRASQAVRQRILETHSQQ